MTAPERPGPERPGPDYPPEWDAEQPDLGDLPGAGPACPRCGGGPVLPVPRLGAVCKSCARVVGP